MTAHLEWWQTAVFYQVYPRSFADGNGDGIGDLEGIIAKLDYLVDLGVEAIWLSPHYPSPQFDCGYDIADYTGVDPDYGDLEGFKRFLEEAHRRGLRVVLDLVLNHTSDQHPWFLESRSSRDNLKRDWYIWRDSRSQRIEGAVRDGGGPEGDRLPPNNWGAAFDESAWTYDPTTDQWYYHFFFAEQPDLNWRNPEVKAAMFEAVRFWLDMGVDGYRLDAIGTIFEDPDLPDHDAEISMQEFFQQARATFPDQPDPETQAYLYEQRKRMNRFQINQPGVHELMQDLRALIDTYDDRVLIGETDEIAYYGDGTNELHMVFNFPLMRTDRLTPDWIRTNQAERLGALPPAAWPCNTLNNHDSPRVYSRYGNNPEMARLSLALMLTLKGTPFLYNGEEIGMTDLMLSDIAQFRDNLGVWIYRVAVDEMGLAPEAALAMVATITRDKNRTPMQWSNSPNAGFSPAGVTTWLPVNPNYAAGVNVAEQRDDPGSLWHFYQAMLQVRKHTPALVAGDYQVIHPEAEDYLAFTRSTEAQRCLVILNYSDQVLFLSFHLDTPKGKLVFSTRRRDDLIELRSLDMTPYEVLIVEMD
jgi:alpha-glucosidase